MKVGIITFHASHNYGSMLQAYALQRTVMKLGHECQIINLRTDVQKNFYKPFYCQEGWRKKAKALAFPKLAFNDCRKHRKFESFLNKNLILSPKEYHSPEELKNADLDFDAYISGSDQIWNTICMDHLSSYFLDFVKTGKRIAYAPSMGPKPEIEVEERFNSFIQNSISRYQAVSVREERTALKIKQICGIDCKVVADPTLLLSYDEWSKLAGKKTIVSGKYILLYTPWYDNYNELYEQAETIADRENIKIICTIPEAYRRWHKSSHFKYVTAVGPKEFLNLIKYSQYVLCGSFHAVVFSLLFKKPFYAYRGMDDSRVSQLLKLSHLEDRTEIPNTIINKRLNYDKSLLDDFIKNSLEFLKQSLS